MTTLENYRPSAKAPWRVVWGFGAFRDFPTQDEAKAFYESLNAESLPCEPFNAAERWRVVRA